MEYTEQLLPARVEHHHPDSTGAAKSSPFIEANTIASSLEEIKAEHIITVLVKDNETLISQAEYIEGAQEIAYEYF
ncbi:MAG: DUF3871 family protein, partial [Bacteroidota bacterium]